jgi:hypothetical protein
MYHNALLTVLVWFGVEPLQVVEVLEAVNLVLADSGYSVLLGVVSASNTSTALSMGVFAAANT